MTSAPLRTLWLLQEPDAARMEALRQSRLPLLMQRLLALRGLETAGEALAFLEPRLAELGEPFSLPDVEKAATRILQAVDRQEQVILYGDYDVDGVTSLSLMTEVLRAYGLACESFLPLRMEEGYGLSLEGLARCFEKHGTPQLLIALDCGTGSVQEVAWMREQGVDCVIVDHHEPGPVLPACVALVNPKLTGEDTYFCTVGLVFKLAHGLLKQRRLEHFDLREHLDLVALGTVADLVPLTQDNRVLVRKGLERLTATRRPGVQALKNVARLEGPVQAHHIGFRLGPRLNAAGRLDTAQTALDLLLCDDPFAAREAAEMLDAHNRERQNVEATVQREAEAMIQANPQLAEASCLVLGSSSWHPGVVGIVASRLMREHHRPTILIAFDRHGMGKGSGRSVPGISLVEALNSCRSLIEKGGGHAMAAGVSLVEEQLGAFRDAMVAAVNAQITADELTPVLHVDAEVDLDDLSPEFLDHYTRLEPFGMANAEPVFVCRGVQPQLPGQIIKEKHWKLVLKQKGAARPAIWFNAPLQAMPPTPWDVILKVQRQFWRGQESWQIMLSEVRSSEG